MHSPPATPAASDDGAHPFHASMFSPQVLAPLGWTFDDAITPNYDVKMWDFATPLLDWYNNNLDAVHEFLALQELEVPVEHMCLLPFADGVERSCVVLSPNGHYWRSSECPDGELQAPLRSPLFRADPDQKVMSPEEKAVAPGWRRQNILEGLHHKFKGSPWLALDGDALGRVMRRKANRDQLWVLEGQLTWSMVTAEVYSDVGKFALLWACVYRARTGIQVSYEYFRLLSQATTWRKLSDEDLRVKEAVDGPYPPQLALAWDMFMSVFADHRGRWEYPANVTEGVVPMRNDIAVENTGETLRKGIPSTENADVFLLARWWMRVRKGDVKELAQFHNRWFKADVMTRAYAKQYLVRNRQGAAAHSLPLSPPLTRCDVADQVHREL